MTRPLKEMPTTHTTTALENTITETSTPRPRWFKTAHAPQLADALERIRGPVGVYSDGHRLALVVGTSAWQVLLTKNDASSFVSTLRESKREPWTVEPLHRTVRILKELDPAFDLHTVRNATAAEAIVVGDPALRAAGERGDPGEAHTSAIEGAGLAQATATSLSCLTPELRKIALRGVTLDKVWRNRVVNGWPVNLDLLLALGAASEVERVRITMAAGLDLTANSKASELKTIIAWLAEVGVHPADKGRPSVSSDALDGTPEPTDPEAVRRLALVRDAKAVERTANTYNSLRSRYEHGRVHAELRLFSARTGRTSIRKASLQNVGRKSRPLLTASPGMTLVAADLSAAEYRIAAAMSGDVALLAAVESSDLYVAIARSMFGLTEVTGEDRDRAKTVALAVLYGQGATSTGVKLKVAKDRARELMDEFWALYPQLDEFNQAMKALAGTQLYTRTIGRPLAVVPVEMAYKSLNAVVQGECADLITVRAEQVAAALKLTCPAGGLFHTVHDELVVEVPIGQEQAGLDVLALLAQPFLGHPMRAEPVVLGRNWSKA